ncbi:MAG TPA: GNAT family N-acetyltransferase [Streptosporangiaceae bacterium]|nr:GNAT family N-acetyltransferase [Streptosporangiaceae bacterium]
MGARRRVQPFGLYRGKRLVAYGELWVDDGEAEVELARLIVDPGERGQGLGKYLATRLARLARFRRPRVLLRVHPGNTAALRCYAAAGFDPVGLDQAAAWNTGQPIDYVWLIPAA